MANGNQGNTNWLDELIKNLASIVDQKRGEQLPVQDVAPPGQSASVPGDFSSKQDAVSALRERSSGVQSKSDIQKSGLQNVSNVGLQASSGSQQSTGATLTFGGSGIAGMISSSLDKTISSGSASTSASFGGIIGFSGPGSSNNTGTGGDASTTIKNPISPGGMATGGFDGRITGANTTKTGGASSNPSDANRPPSGRSVPPVEPPPDKPTQGTTSTSQAAGDNAFGFGRPLGGTTTEAGISPPPPQPPPHQPGTPPTVPPPPSQPPPSPTSTSGTGTVHQPPSQPPPSPSNTTFIPPPSPPPQTSQTTQGGTSTSQPPSPPPSPPPPPATQTLQQPAATFDVPVLVMPQVVWDYIGTFSGTPPSLELAADNSTGLPKPFIPRPDVPEAYRNLEVATYYTYPSFFNGRKVDWTLSVGNRSLLPAYYVWPVNIVSFDYPAGVALHHVRDVPDISRKANYLVRIGLLGWDALSQVSRFSARLSQIAGINELLSWTSVSSGVAENEVILLSPFMPGNLAPTVAYAGTETQEAPFTFFVRAYDSRAKRFVALNSNPLVVKSGETISVFTSRGWTDAKLPGFPDPVGLHHYAAGFYYPIYLGVTLALRDDIVQADRSKNLSDKMAKWLAGMPCVFAIVSASVTDWSFRPHQSWYANVPPSPYSELVREQTVVRRATSKDGVQHTFRLHARIETAKVELGLALMVPLFAAWVNPSSARAPISKMAKEWVFSSNGRQSLGCLMSFGTLIYNTMRDGSVRFDSLAIRSDDQVIKDMGISNLSIKFSRDVGILNEVPNYDANDPDFVYIGQTMLSYMLLPSGGAKHTIVKVTPDMFQLRTGLLTHSDGVAAMRPIKSLNAYLIYLAAPIGKSITSPVQFKSNETDEKMYGVVKCNIGALTRPGDIVPDISLNVRNLACLQAKSSFKKHWPVTFYGSKIDFVKAVVDGKLSASRLIEAWNPPSPSDTEPLAMVGEGAMPIPEYPGNVPSPFGAVDIAFDRTGPYYWLTLAIWPEEGRSPMGRTFSYDFLVYRFFGKGTPPNTSNRLLNFQNLANPVTNVKASGYTTRIFGAISYGTNEYRWASNDKIEFTYTPLKTDPQKQEWITLTSKTGRDAPLDISRWLVVVIPNPPSRYPSILGTILPPAKEDVPYCIARYPVISRNAINQLYTDGKSLRQFFSNFRPKGGNARYRLLWIDTLCKVKMMDEKKAHLGLEMGGAIEEIRELDSRKDNDRTLMTLHNNIVNPQPDSFLSIWHSALWYYSEPSLFAKLPVLFDEVLFGNTSYGEMRYVPVYAYSCANAFPYGLQRRSADLITKVVVSESDRRVDTMYLKVISPIAWLGSKVFIPAILLDGVSVDSTRSGTGGTQRW